MSIYAEAATVKLDKLKRESLSQNHSRSKSRSAASRIWSAARRSAGLGAVLMIFFGAIVFLAFWTLPDIQLSKSWSRLPPWTLEQLVEQRDVIVAYSESHLMRVLACLCLLYIFMQSFAIPGTLTLSLMAGALLGVPKGLSLVSVVSTIGACSCYGVSQLLGRELAGAIWPERLAYFQEEVEKQRNNMLSYILFLRLTPIFPNTFINLASPIVGVPLSSFSLGTIIGCIPNNLLAVNAGSKLKKLRTMSELYDIRLLSLGVLVGIIALVPVWIKSKDNGKSDKKRA